MSDRSIVADQLARKNAEILVLEDKIKSARIYVRALEDVLRAMERGGAKPPEVGDLKLQKGSLVAQARDVILERGSPMYIDDLLVALGREPTRESKASLGGSLAAYVRKDEIFTRPAPSTFGLIELGHTEMEGEPAAELPPNFGQVQGGDMDDGISF